MSNQLFRRQAMDATKKRKRVKYVVITVGLLMIGGLLLVGCSPGHSEAASRRSDEIGNGSGRRLGATSPLSESADPTDVAEARAYGGIQRLAGGGAGPDESPVSDTARFARQNASTGGTELSAVRGIQGGRAESVARSELPTPLSASSSDTEVISLAGMLRSEGEEWFLQSEADTYQLGFGPPSFREEHGINLEDGAYAEVRGRIADGGEVEVITCVTNSEEYFFRTEGGIAMWSGRYRIDSVTGQGSDAPSPRGGGGRGNASDELRAGGGRRGQTG